MMLRRLFLVAGISRRTTLNFPEMAFACLRHVLAADTLAMSGCSASPEMSDSKWLLPVP